MRNKIVLAVVIILQLVCIVLGAMLYHSKEDDVVLQHANVTIDNNATETGSENNDLSNLSVLFCGFDDSVVSNDTVIHLTNNEDNDPRVFIKYVVLNKDTEETLFETDLISAGKSVNWTPQLPDGVYNISFDQYGFYDQGNGDYVEVAHGRNTVCYTVKNKKQGD